MFRVSIASVLLLVCIIGCDDIPNGATTIDADTTPTVATETENNAVISGLTTETDEDLKTIQGTWETIRMVTAGEDLPPERIRSNVTVTFKDDQMITKRKGEVKATWKITLDSSKIPKRMTINTADAGEKARLSYQIYKIEGDTLTTCSGSRDFPVEFTEDTEKGCYLTVRKRVNP